MVLYYYVGTGLASCCTMEAYYSRHSRTLDSVETTATVTLYHTIHGQAKEIPSSPSTSLPPPLPLSTNIPHQA